MTMIENTSVDCATMNNTIHYQTPLPEVKCHTCHSYFRPIHSDQDVCTRCYLQSKTVEDLKDHSEKRKAYRQQISEWQKKAINGDLGPLTRKKLVNSRRRTYAKMRLRHKNRDPEGLKIRDHIRHEIRRKNNPESIRRWNRERYHSDKQNKNAHYTTKLYTQIKGLLDPRYEVRDLY